MASDVAINFSTVTRKQLQRQILPVPLPLDQYKAAMETGNYPTKYYKIHVQYFELS